MKSQTHLLLSALWQTQHFPFAFIAECADKKLRILSAESKERIHSRIEAGFKEVGHSAPANISKLVCSSYSPDHQPQYTEMLFFLQLLQAKKLCWLPLII
ncbi:hypothetical protein XENORESO_020205 [Xenotaenia resolanae]|uniref:Uncharacterized protein n=1 Tax=Xenotaenia resolanae TaxID=208358 RepID=A0ABV0WZM1_9TELE